MFYTKEAGTQRSMRIWSAQNSGGYSIVINELKGLVERKMSGLIYCSVILHTKVVGRTLPVNPGHQDPGVGEGQLPGQAGDGAQPRGYVEACKETLIIPMLLIKASLMLTNLQIILTFQVSWQYLQNNSLDKLPL